MTPRPGVHESQEQREVAVTRGAGGDGQTAAAGRHALCEMAEHGLCDQEAENVSTIPMAGYRPKYLLCHDHLVEFGWAVEESEAFATTDPELIDRAGGASVAEEDDRG